MRNSTEKSSKLLYSWGEIAPETTFAGQSLEEFRAIVEPVTELRASIVKADQDRVANVILRNTIQKDLSGTYLRIVNAIKTAPEHGEDFPLYGAIGYVVRSAKQPGLSRVKKTV